MWWYCVDVPGPPEHVKFTDVTDTSFKLNWGAPAYDGGSPVTGYNVEMYDGSSWDEVNTTPIETYSHVLSTPALDKGQQLTVRVYAMNEVGNGPPSEAALRICNPPGCPDAPDVERRTGREGLVTIKPPDDDGGSPIIRYVVEIKAKSGTLWTSARGQHHSELEFMATDLKPSLEYAFRVTAENVAGPGQPSPPSTLEEFGNYKYHALLDVLNAVTSSNAGEILHAILQRHQTLPDLYKFPLSDARIARLSIQCI